MSFFADLKRRNVFRVAAGYVLAGWLLVQVVETIFPAFGFGDAAVRIVVIVLGIGFVPVLIFAWVFELTPDGLEKEKDIDRSKPIAGGSGNRLNFVIIGLFALSLGYFAYDKLVLEPGRNSAASLNAVEVLAEVRELVDSSLGGGDFTDAYDLAIKAEEVIPDHAELQELIARSSLLVNISSNPAGASVYMKKYSQPEADWTWVGETPLAGLRLPVGIFRWKIEKEGFNTSVAAASTWIANFGGKEIVIPNKLHWVLDQEGSVPEGMVRVTGRELTDELEIEDFHIDRTEVTNAQFKKFVDAGGYTNRDFWRYPFIEDGKTLEWEEATRRFVDLTGRSSPANWEAGDFPDGQAQFPVAGVSWYEAAAYAAYAGRELPTVTHWGLARGDHTPLVQSPQLGGFAILAPFSNFGGEGPVAAGSLDGITAYGAYDMAGNVREWCMNTSSYGRVVRGGAWNDNSYRFAEVSQEQPFERAANLGFRTVLYANQDPLPQASTSDFKYRKAVNYYDIEPVSDEVFEIYLEQFAYDRDDDLNSRLELRNDDASHWVKERVSFDAAYGNERIIANLFLPKNFKPPYQTVIYFPGRGSMFHESSKDIEQYYEFPVYLSFLIKSGRAVLYPVYVGTFERRNEAGAYRGGGLHAHRDWKIQLVKDFARSIDYLESRDDIDHDKLAYYGMSWGSVTAPVILAIENRLKAAVLLAGGLVEQGRPEVNPINYISRVSTPLLLMSGRYDTIFPYQQSIKPMFDLIGTPVEDKVIKVYETDHIPPRAEYIKEILAWLNERFGEPE
jgi:dienelactone hydrolase